MPFRPGDTIHKIYRVLAKLSQGGFGTLYLGYDVAEERLVALKESKATEEAQQALQEEVMLLSQIEHESLVRIYDHFTSDEGRFCFVMEYLPGDNLENSFKRGQRPPLDLAVGWIIQILEALSVLHQRPRPIIHHDVKLSNIQIHGITNRAYLLDLGVARSGPYTTIPPYSAPYAPPEQYEQRRTTTATDIYAVGICLYMLLTGVQPPESLARQRNEQLEPLQNLHQHIVPELEQVVMRSIDLDPARRYPHAVAMLGALRAAIESQQRASYGAAMRQYEPKRLSTLLPQGRKQLRVLLRQRRIYRRLLLQRRKRIVVLLRQRRIYRRRLTQHRALIRHCIADLRNLNAAAASLQRRYDDLSTAYTALQRQHDDEWLDRIWSHSLVKMLGLILMVLCGFMLVLRPGDFLIVYLIIPLLGSYPLLALVIMAGFKLQAHGWHWHPVDSLLKLSGCLFYSMFISLLVVTLISHRAGPYLLGIVIPLALVSLGLLAGVVVSGALTYRFEQ